MRKKIVSLLLGVSVMAALLGGCGGKESGGESSRAEQASGDETKTGGEEASGGEVKTLEFMWGIRLNNNREWFTAHKQDYLDHLYTPTMELGREVYERFMEK